MNKVCDGADWFRLELDRIIRRELEESPRFHRKQWEFAVIYRELERLGLLDGNAEGISFGTGRERLLYAVARRVKHVWATDLYGEEAAWDLARTGNPSKFLRTHAPFPVPEERLSAKHMDMREISFPDGTFDFAWSSCAIEHIGHRSDFIRHLQEVRRVLKPGGVYVLTTEFTWADQAAELEGNYFFSRGLLEDIVRESGLDSDPEFDASLTRHGINVPLPLELSGGRNDGLGRYNERLFESLAHLQLSSASTAFTSCVVVLRKSGESFKGWRFSGFEDATQFIGEGLDGVRRIVEEADLALEPFADLPHRRSRHYVGHEAFFREIGASTPSASEKRTLFHSAYVWLGRRPRLLRVSLGSASAREFNVNLRVHRCSMAKPWGAVRTELETELRGVDGRAMAEIPLSPRDDCTYAVLAENPSGDLVLNEVSIKAAAAGSMPIWTTGSPPLQPGAIASLYAAARALRRFR